MSKVTVVKTITEHTNGRRKDENSPTGWVRRAGSRPLPVNDRSGKRSIKRTETIWEPCDAPLTEIYEGHMMQGGTIRHEIKVEGDATVSLSQWDVQQIVEHLLPAASRLSQTINMQPPTVEDLRKQHALIVLLERFGVTADQVFDW